MPGPNLLKPPKFLVPEFEEEEEEEMNQNVDNNAVNSMEIQSSPDKYIKANKLQSPAEQILFIDWKESDQKRKELEKNNAKLLRKIENLEARFQKLEENTHSSVVEEQYKTDEEDLREETEWIVERNRRAKKRKMFLSADIWWLISKPDLPGWLDYILDPRIDKEIHLILTTVLLSVVALASVCLILTVFTEEKNLMIGSVFFTLGRFALTIDLWRQFLRSILKNEELELDWLHTNYQWTTSNLVELFIYKICLQLNSIDLQILIILCSYFAIKFYILLHLNGYYIELGEDEDE